MTSLPALGLAGRRQTIYILLPVCFCLFVFFPAVTAVPATRGPRRGSADADLKSQDFSCLKKKTRPFQEYSNNNNKKNKNPSLLSASTGRITSASAGPDRQPSSASPHINFSQKQQSGFVKSSAAPLAPGSLALSLQPFCRFCSENMNKSGNE